MSISECFSNQQVSRISFLVPYAASHEFFLKKVVVNDIKTHLRESAPRKLIEFLRVVVVAHQKVQASQCEGTFHYTSYTSKVLSMKVLESY